MANNTKNALITVHNCKIQSGDVTLVNTFDWSCKSGENWLITGTNGGGKTAFGTALSMASANGTQAKNAQTSNAQFVPAVNNDSFYSNIFTSNALAVSFESASHLIAEEKANDESEFIEGGVDKGRTPRVLLSAHFLQTDKSCALDSHPLVKLFGIERILDRGLKYLSTGEIRRTLLASALIAEPELLILDEPFEGLDVETREKLKNYLAEHAKNNAPYIILLMDRFDYVPANITHVLEFSKGEASFCGTVDDYRKIVKKRQEQEKSHFESLKASLIMAVKQAQQEGMLQHRSLFRQNDADGKDTSTCASEQNLQNATLIQMQNVCVGWDGKKVLDNINWSVRAGEHWLIRGPNGSGKTTLLELITGDNSQVFCNKVYLFGKKRGSGETIWDIKQRLGIVSYRLHVDYRNFGDMSALAVVISGLHDSIGLYDEVGDVEKALARSWLMLCGLAQKESVPFKTLSYGEQRAVLIARAVVKCPLILILDEPCHGLDRASKERILSILETIANSGLTTLLHVTHDADEVLACEKHILELKPACTPMYQIITR